MKQNNVWKGLGNDKKEKSCDCHNSYREMFDEV